jgi:hypothetical protein
VIRPPTATLSNERGLIPVSLSNFSSSEFIFASSVGLLASRLGSVSLSARCASMLMTKSDAGSAARAALVEAALPVLLPMTNATVARSVTANAVSEK